MVSAQVRQCVKNFEWKLDSVRKERESVILIIETIVKEVFEPKQMKLEGLNRLAVSPTIPVGIK